MKKMFLFTLVMVCSSIVSALAEDQSSAAPLETGWLLFIKLAEPYEVFIDGSYKGTTPLLITDLTPTAKEVTIRSNTEYISRGLRVNENVSGITYFEPVMSPYAGTLSVTSDPSGANVYIAGVDVGVTPCRVPDVLIGEHEVEIEKDGYFPETIAVRIGHLQEFKAVVTLRTARYLTLPDALPDNAVIKIFGQDGRLIAEGSADDEYVIPPELVRVEMSGETFETAVIPVHGADENPEVNHNPEFYTPAIVLENLLPESRVFLDDVEVTDTVTGNTFFASAGTHTVKIITDKYLPSSKLVQLSGNEVHNVAVTYIEDPAVLEQRKRIIKTSAIAAGGVLTAGSLALNVDSVAVQLSNSYQQYVTLKYVTLGTGSAGLAVLTTAVILSILR